MSEPQGTNNGPWSDCGLRKDECRDKGRCDGHTMTGETNKGETRLELLNRVSRDLGWHTDSRGRDVVEVEIEILLDWIIEDRHQQTIQARIEHTKFILDNLDSQSDRDWLLEQLTELDDK